VARQGRHAEEIALDLVAAFRAQPRQLLFRLDAFGGGLHTEAAAQPDDGANDQARFAGGGDVANEGVMALELVVGEATQLAQ
jgi:hypothetical protein